MALVPLAKTTLICPSSVRALQDGERGCFRHRRHVPGGASPPVFVGLRRFSGRGCVMESLENLNHGRFSKPKKAIHRALTQIDVSRNACYMLLYRSR